MSPTARGRMGLDRESAVIGGLVTAAVCVVLAVAASGKLSLYFDALERSGLLFALPVVAVAGLFALLRYQRLSVHALAFLLPFNFVGGLWGSDIIVLVAKIAMNVLLAAGVIVTLLAPRASRLWLTETKLGVALLAWLATIGIGIVLGLLGAPNREFWLRESAWVLFFAAALPFGTLIQRREDIRTLVWATCAGVGVLQLYAFWALVTGTRYARADAWVAGASFFRAPYSCVSLFVLYLAVAALFYRASARVLTRRAAGLLFIAIALLLGGLLASMGRSLWIAGAMGMAVVVFVAPWDRRTAKAAGSIVAGAALSIAIVTAVDRLSPSTSGNWTASAITFLMDLGARDSSSRVTREIEWGHAIDVWKRSPLLGMGFGYSYPQVDFVKVPAEVIPDAFYMHNSYFNILAKTGIVGLVALLYLMWRTVIDARALLKSPRADLEELALAAAIIAGVASVAMLTSTMPVLTAGDPAAYFGMLVGLTVALRRAHKQRIGV